MISPTDLKYFIETARSQHISRAAERLGITQPALSHCIQKMEQEVGLELFLRSKKGVSLTPAGRRLYEQSESLLNQWNRTLQSIHEETTQVGGLIRLGCHTAVAQYMLPSFLPKLLSDYPLIQLQLLHGLSRHMTEEVVSSRIDAAIVVNPVPHPDLVIRDLCRDVIGVWKAKGCINKNLIMHDPSLLQSQDILKRLSKNGKVYEQVLESSSLEVLAQLLVAGAGAAILPERVVKAFAEKGSVHLEQDAPTYQDKVCLVFRPEFKKSEKGREFLKYADQAW